MMNSKMKRGYKVTDKNRQKMIGIACDSLSELLAKGSQKLMINEEVRAVLNDGTIVDNEEYFQVLPPQTIFILHRKNEDILTGVDIILDVLRGTNLTYLNTGLKARDVLLEKAQMLVKVLEEKKGNSSANTREEDPEWFEGLDTNAKTKDEFMNRKSRDRIRGYFYKFQEDVRKNKLYLENECFRKMIQKCIETFKKHLETDGYFGCYFDRRCASNVLTKVRNSPENDISISESPKRPKIEKNIVFDRFDWESNYEKTSFCDALGNFVCQGKWQMKKCEFSSEHCLNPYASKKNRLLFSTWNLDHSTKKPDLIYITVTSKLFESERVQNRLAKILETLVDRWIRQSANI